jgi:hypothetical protein
VLARHSMLPVIALLAITLAAACGARAVGAGDLPEPGQAVAFAQIDVAGIRMSRLAIREVVAGGAKQGATVATIKARQGRNVYAVYLAPGQYAVSGVLTPGDIENGIPSGRGGVLLFEVAPKTASYFGTFRPLTESGMTSVADLGQPAFEAASVEFARKHPVLKAGFEIVNAIATTDVMKSGEQAPQPTSDSSFEAEWDAGP